MYKYFIEHYLAIPLIAGVKSESERFAGAEETFCIEAIMPDGKGLQMGTSHVLLHSFPEAFGIAYQDKEGTMQTPYCTSWGVTTRMIGGLIMMHGDANGLVLPPRIAPIQVVIVPIYRTEEDKERVIAQAHRIKDKLATQNIRVHIDDDDTKKPGAKFFHWELKGVPVRIELGPKDLEQNQAVLVNRIEHEKDKKKAFVSLNTIESSVSELLESIQEQLFARASERVAEMMQQGDDIAEFGPTLEKENGVYQTGWCGARECENKLKPHKGTIRCQISEKRHAKCFACDKPSVADVIIAKSY